MSATEILGQIRAPGAGAVLAAAADPRELIAALEAAGLFAALVDRAPVFDKQTLLHALYQACEMPHFGFNWDALLDALSDWEWRPAEGYVLVFQRFGSLARRAPDDAQTFLEIVREAHHDRNTPLWVVLLEPAPG